MRNALTYGALGGGALLAGGQAVKEQEDPGSIFLAGLGGGAGAVGGLGAAKGLAGKFSPALRRAMGGAEAAGQGLAYRYLSGDQAPRSSLETRKFVENRPKKQGPVDKLLTKEAKEYLEATEPLNPGYTAMRDVVDPRREGSLARRLGKATAFGTVPAIALAGGFGGVTAGGVLGAAGLPGFVDPESYGSSNSPGARYKQTTVNYV